MKPRALTALAAVVASATLSVARADVITVGPSQDIQDAIDLLMINSDPTDTVRIAPGTYAESLVIDFSGTNQTGLTIVRDQNQRPIITGGILVRDAFRVTLYGLRVDSPHGDGNAAIRVRDSSAVSVERCSGFAGDDGGLDASDSFEIVVLDSDFVGMDETGGEGGIGVRIDGGCAHYLDDVVASSNEAIGFLIEADEVRMAKLVAEGNGEGGIAVHGFANSLSKSDANKNDGFGIEVVGVCDVKKCDVNGNEGTGIRFGEDGGATMHGGSIRNCNVKKSGGNGIVVKEEHRGLLIQENKVIESGGSAVRLVGDANHVTKNTIKDSKSGSDGGHGVLVTSSSGRNCIDQNTFNDNSGVAVRVEGDSNYVLANKGKGGDGFVDAGGSGNSGRANSTSGTNHFP
ncbi:MAG: right-handed parallel beta-helix repeat-containing protein [Planctomycetota bacterium JB042]